MGKRILLAGLAGGVLVFIVSGILHSSTKLAEVGIRAIPNEDLVLLAMRNSIPEAGFYYFPAPNLSPMSKEEKAAEQSRYLAKFKQGPTGILVYKPGGEDSNFGKLLATQFLIGLAAAFIAAWILGATASAHHVRHACDNHRVNRTLRGDIHRLAVLELVRIPHGLRDRARNWGRCELGSRWARDGGDCEAACSPAKRLKA